MGGECPWRRSARARSPCAGPWPACGPRDGRPAGKGSSRPPGSPAPPARPASVRLTCLICLPWNPAFLGRPAAMVTAGHCNATPPSSGEQPPTETSHPAARLPENLEQPLSQDRRRVGILPRDQVAVLHHERLPERAPAELDADLLLELGLEQPLRLGGEPDGLLLVVGEAGDPVALERRLAVDPGGQDRGRGVAHDRQRPARGEL